MSGEPVVLKTSFNVRAEPIVTTPQNAFNTFAHSGIDSLIMGDILVEKG